MSQVPLTFLKSAKDTYVMVELKNGEVFNGTVVDMDSFMNIRLKKVVRT